MTFPSLAIFPLVEFQRFSFENVFGSNGRKVHFGVEKQRVETAQNATDLPFHLAMAAFICLLPIGALLQYIQCWHQEAVGPGQSPTLHWTLT